MHTTAPSEPSEKLFYHPSLIDELEELRSLYDEPKFKIANEPLPQLYRNGQNFLSTPSAPNLNRIHTYSSLTKLSHAPSLGRVSTANSSLYYAPGSVRQESVRYLASGCTFKEVYYNYRLGYTTICTIIREVCDIICQHHEKFIIMPNTENDWETIANGFEKNSNFPHCIGAIDGKHIRLIQPINSGSLYYNYKHYFSIVLLAICDANYNFTYVDIGAYGKSSDSGIFKETSFYQNLVSNSLNIPEAKPLENGEYIPYTVVEDEAFGLHENLMRPYGGHNLSYKQKIFNYRLSRARRFIECTFGILSNKWRIFHRPLNVHIELAKKIVKTCCILHNFVRSRDGYSYDDTLTIPGFQAATDQKRNRGGRTALTFRDKLAEYFVNYPLPWQERNV